MRHPPAPVEACPPAAAAGPAVWDADDLERRLCRALDLARQTLRLFAAEGHVNADTPALSFGPEKPVAETAMLLYAASACRHRPAVARRVDDLVQLLVPHARSQRALVDMALHPAMAFKVALPHVLLTQLGCPDAPFDRLLAICAAQALQDGHDRPPSARLERAWISGLWSGASARVAWRRNARQSVLHRPIDLLGGLRDDAYAFTHLMFYCTDFGHGTPSLPRARSSILAQAQCMLARYLDVEDYDLSAELLLAWPFTSAPWTATSAFAFRLLASVEDQVGLLPCGNVDLARLSRLQGDERERYALATGYHTAYVMGLLCAAALRPGHAPPTRIPGRRHRAAVLQALRPHAADDRGHWQPEFDALEPDEQLALVPFILDLAIVHRSRQRDYPALISVLDIARRAGLAGSPMAKQAGDLLQRIAGCAVALGGGACEPGRAGATPRAGAPAEAHGAHS